MYNYNKSVLSPYDPTKLAIHSILHPEDDLISKCGPNLKKTVSFDDVVHFIDEENMVTYVDFDCGIKFNLERTHIRCSLQCERRTVKERDCASALHSFKEFTYRTDEWTKQLLRLRSWVISGSPEQWIELHRLWWTVIVSKCSYLFHLFDFYCLLVKFLFFRKFTFLFPFFDNFEWATKIHCHFLCNVTLL